MTTNYTINISRSGNTGMLSFSHGSINVSTICWWDVMSKSMLVPILALLREWQTKMMVSLALNVRESGWE